MRCPIEGKENAELLLSYSARRLDPGSAAVLEAHMESCPACREFRNEQQALWKTLDQWEALPVSLDFDRRLFRKIEEQEQLSWWSRVFGPLGSMLWRPALPLAATACLMLVAGFVSIGPDKVTAPVALESPQVREVEQVEKALDDLDMLRQFDIVANREDHSRSM
jgi:anti-sigma factor RsiW